MSDLTFRRTIRGILETLPDGRWMRMAAIYDRLPEPRPPKPYLSVELTAMTRAEMVMRRGESKSFEYRAGPAAVVDRRALRKGVKKEPAANLGFRELARLEQTDPEAYARIVARDPLSFGAVK